jgi:PAS domain S-box-containing protein
MSEVTREYSSISATELLLEMGRITRGNLTRDEALQRISDLVNRSFPVEAVAILSFDSGSKSTWVSASSWKSEDHVIVPLDMKLKMDTGSCLYKALSDPGGTTILPAELEDSVLGPPRHFDLLIVPMASGEEVSGFMLLAFDRGSILTTKADFFISIASQAAMIAAKAQLIQRLRISEDRYEMLMENASDLVFLLDRGGRFLYVNPRSKDMLGYKPEEMEGRYFGEFVSPNSWADTVAVVKKAVSKRERFIEYSWTIQRCDGKFVPLLVRASLLYQGYELVRHQGIARDTSVETRLKEEIQRTEKELDRSKARETAMKGYLSVATKAQEEERGRIARELHDGPVQYLVAMRRRLDLLRKSLKEPSDSSALRLIDDLDNLLDTTAGDLREFSLNLRPPVLDDFGLASACEYLAGKTEKEGISVDFSVNGTVCRLEPDIEVSVFRIIQEGLSNAVKHASATEISLDLSFGPDSLTVSLHDNGRGFDTEISPNTLMRAGQMGLVGMFERAELIGASINLTSKPGQGTTLVVSLPIAHFA